MICPPCREAADKDKPEGHNDCVGKGRESANAESLKDLAYAPSPYCDCQHRQGHWINKEK